MYKSCWTFNMKKIQNLASENNHYLIMDQIIIICKQSDSSITAKCKEIANYIFIVA
jgi:hypothetical protein